MTKSSTETELVGVSDMISQQVIWTRHFLETQGYQVKDSIVNHQDNQSAMLMEKNGRASSGKRTRHINIRYFFITDQVPQPNNELTIEYRPTKRR